jgi:hypothetical protein
MRRWRLPAALLVVALLVGALLPALANIVPDDRTVPRIAVVARGDNPIDALSSAPIAGATGGIVVLTVPAELTQPAADALKAFAPDVVILAGGTAALSEQVRAQVAALGSWEVRRVSGADRYLTAGALATVLADYGLDGLAVSDAVPAHAKTVYVQDTGDEATNGAALRAAAATITAPAYGWRIVLDPGRYDVGTETLVLPSEIEVVGAGRSLTKIVGTVTAAAAVREAAVVAGEPGGHLALRALTVENLGTQAGTAAIAVFCDGWLEVQDAEIGQNTNKTDDDNSASYGIVSRGGFWIRDSYIVGMSESPNVGMGILLDGYGGRVENSHLRTQGGDVGAGIVITTGGSGNVTITHSRFTGNGEAQGFIQRGTGTLDIQFSQFLQEGQDGTVSAGRVNIASSQREKTVTEAPPGVAECAYNFTPAMTASDC